jgi:hypothetical protein
MQRGARRTDVRHDGSVEEAFAAAFGTLAVAGVLFDVGDQTRIENALPIVGGIKTAVEIDIGAFEVQPHRFGHLFQGVRALREQDHVGLVDRRHGDGRYDIALNWLRVLGTAERSQVDQRVHHQLHPVVALLDACKAEQQALAFVFTHWSHLDRFLILTATTLASTLSVRTDRVIDKYSAKAHNMVSHCKGGQMMAYERWSGPR